MAQSGDHVCRFVRQLRWRPWRDIGQRREREGVSVQRCQLCAAERATRRPLRAIRLEVETGIAQPTPLREPNGCAVAKLLLRKSHGAERLTGRGIYSRSASSFPESLIDQWLERFLEAGWVRLDYKVQGSKRTLFFVYLRNPVALEEFAEPGRRIACAVALDAARQRVAALDHPIGSEVAQLLSGERADRMPPALVIALASVAEHISMGDVLAERVFATRYLGHSKALAPLRRRIEHFLGPLEALGIREGAAITLVGGSGKIVIGWQSLDLRCFVPFFGLAREQLTGDLQLQFPPEGLFIVENLAVFEACCRGEVAAANASFIVWSAGYPGRAVRRLVEEAVEARVRVRAWADLDLDGIRIARLLASWAPSGYLEPYRMEASDVLSAPIRQQLSRRARVQIAANLAAHPEALLAPTLRAIGDSEHWVEQECFLGQPALHSGQSSPHLAAAPQQA